MKTASFILTIVLLSFSIGNAQSKKNGSEVIIEPVISVSQDNIEISILPKDLKKDYVEDEKLISTFKLRHNTVKAKSDMHIYLNIILSKNGNNINALFPKMKLEVTT